MRTISKNVIRKIRSGQSAKYLKEDDGTLLLCVVNVALGIERDNSEFNWILNHNAKMLCVSNIIDEIADMVAPVFNKVWSTVRNTIQKDLEAHPLNLRSLFEFIVDDWVPTLVNFVELTNGFESYSEPVRQINDADFLVNMYKAWMQFSHQTGHRV